jgi:hypothetical protein
MGALTLDTCTTGSTQPAIQDFSLAVSGKWRHHDIVSSFSRGCVILLPVCTSDCWMLYMHYALLDDTQDDTQQVPPALQYAVCTHACVQHDFW